MTAEEALRLYVHYREGGHALRSVELFDRREVCGHCGRGPSTLRGRQGRERAVCASCGIAWRGRMVGGARERVQAPKSRGRVERHVDVWRAVRAAVEPTPGGYDERGWERILELLLAEMSPYVSGTRALAAWADVRWPEAAPHSHVTLWRRLGAARRAIEARLPRLAA